MLVDEAGSRALPEFFAATVMDRTAARATALRTMRGRFISLSCWVCEDFRNATKVLSLNVGFTLLKIPCTYELWLMR